jgi:predicted AAA+ superfamily ATPase
MNEHISSLSRIAAALERLAPPPLDPAPLASGTFFALRPASGGLVRVESQTLPLALLLAVDDQKAALTANTRRFAEGLPANNALLWGVRGAGKSALVKSVVAAVAPERPALKLIEVPRDALGMLPHLVDALRDADARAILFLDDLSFSGEDTAMKALKSALEGGVSGNARTIVYATSNRRQIVARDADENIPRDLLWSDTAEERLSLSDRFGLWLGFHTFDQAQYLDIVAAYAGHFGLAVEPETLQRRAVQWALARGARTGRTAWQFVVALAGEIGAR